ncbi:MAG: glycosyltransferase family 4 protein [Crocinitomicaceae bacterium]
MTSTGWGGLEMNTLKLAKILTSQGYEITLFTQEEAVLHKNHSDSFKGVELITKKRKYFDFKTAKIIAEKLKANKIPLVFVVDNKDIDVLAWTKRLFYKELKIVYQQHMQIGINKKDYIHTFRLRSIDTWISPLQFLKIEIGLRTHFPLNRVKVIPIGLDTAKFLNAKYSKEEARRKMGIETDLPLLGIIGRISEKKGQRFVAEAILALKNKGIHLELVIFGSATVNDEADKKYAEELKDFVDQNDLNQLIHFVDYKEDVHQFYNSIDVFVLASHSETYGMVTIEAMLSGVPIIATNSGGTPEILNNGKWGRLYKYENQEQFCAVLQSALNDMENTRIMTREAKENATILFESTKEVEAIISVFQQYLT